MELRRYVISAPRSGLNWLTFCALRFYGERTPEMPQIFSNSTPGINQYIRSHDPLGASGHKSRAFFGIDPAETRDGVVMLILRDPLETFVRDAKQDFRRFALYPANIRFLTASPAKHKAVFYYEDIVKDPVAMMRALEFLRIESPPGVIAPTAERMAAEWESAAKDSRAAYDIKQARAGGSWTKDLPHDFAYHQRELGNWKKRRVWRYLKRNLTSEEMGLLERYGPNPGHFFGLFGRANCQHGQNGTREMGLDPKSVF